MNDQPFRSDRRVIPWLLAGLVVLFGGLYLAGYLLTSDRVPRGTTVGGVAIGGMRPAAAREALEQGLAGRAGEPVRVLARGERASIRPEAAGLQVDYAESVAQAGGGRSWHPERMWDSLTAGEEMDVVVEVDRPSLSRAVEELAGRVDVEPRDGGLRFARERVVTQEPRPGLALDRARTARLVAAAWTDVVGGAEPQPVRVPVGAVEPDIDRDDLARARSEVANPATSGPVVVEIDDDRVTLGLEVFLPALSFEPRDGELRLRVDRERLLREVVPRTEVVLRDPRDATVRIARGSPQVVSGRTGVTFDREELVEGFPAVVAERGSGRTLRVSARKDRPDLTTAEARDLGVREVVSDYTTYFPYAEYRNVNQGRAAELIDGTLLEPGEVFSLNRIVGERTAANGFTEGTIISDGVYAEDFGGGVSQVATTAFNAMFFAGLEDVEHKPHSFYIDRYPVGREATVAWPYVDLRFRNDSDHGVLVQASVKPSTPSRQGAMNVTLWSTETWKVRSRTSERYDYTAPATRQLSGDDCVPNTGYDGFTVDVTRRLYRPGGDRVVEKERFRTVYTPSDTVVCS